MINSLGKKLVEVLKKAGKFMQDLYVAEDDIWKIINYEVQLVQRGDRYAKAGIKISPQALNKKLHRSCKTQCKLCKGWRV